MQFPEWCTRYERHIPAVVLLFGFLWDTITIGRPDKLFENVIFLSYLALSALAIIFLNLKERRGQGHPLLLLGLIQFCFGNLAGGLLVLYSKSGTFGGSALFFLLLIAFLISNEFLKTRYAYLHFHVSAWYLLSFTYLALAATVLLQQIGTQVFLLSGVASLLSVTLLLSALYAVSAQAIVARLRNVAVSIAVIFALYNGLYFLNVIPPVPLALKGGGIYHTVMKTSSGEYVGRFEAPAWYAFWRDTHYIYTATAGEGAYCFSSIFAPPGFTIPIVHRFEKYEETSGWNTVALVEFPITGGREEGYRIYSHKSTLEEGVYRCSIETQSGGIIGRFTFNSMSGSALLEEELLE